MEYSLKTSDQLILRDGKPFGEEKNFGGSAYNTIMPQTLAGMVRTAIGFSKSPDYFSSDENIEAVKTIAVNRIMYYAKLKGANEFLTPPPADVVFTKDGDGLKFNQLTFGEMPTNCGTDICNKDWLVPSLDCSEKPAKDAPQRWLWDTFSQYLKEGLVPGTNSKLDSIGLAPMVSNIVIHNGLNSETHSTEDGRLFANKQLYMAVKKKNGNKNEIVPIGMYFETSESMPTGAMFLGGERKTVEVEETDLRFPELPNVFNNQRFLKVILITHGKFGGWCPKWLMPNLNANSIDFVNIPDTEYRVRLRSACVNGWDGVSGWDYAGKWDNREGRRKSVPKPLTKLVRPGSVYLLELKDPSQSADIARILWGNSLCSDEAGNDGFNPKNDGFGLAVVGLATKQVKI